MDLYVVRTSKFCRIAVFFFFFLIASIGLSFEYVFFSIMRNAHTLLYAPLCFRRLGYL